MNYVRECVDSQAIIVDRETPDRGSPTEWSLSSVHFSFRLQALVREATHSRERGFAMKGEGVQYVVRGTSGNRALWRHSICLAARALASRKTGANGFLLKCILDDPSCRGLQRWFWIISVRELRQSNYTIGLIFEQFLAWVFSGGTSTSTDTTFWVS
jgi:hypothetical protein